MRQGWLLLACVVELLAFMGLLLWGRQIAQLLHEEVFKLVAQLVLIVALGGLGSVVIEQINQRREQRQQTRERLRAVFSDLVGSYNKIKSLRRRLRAEAIRPSWKSPDPVVVGKDYDVLLQDLNDEQLGIEAHVRLIEGNEDIYPKARQLIQNLAAAEKYLGELVSEWEESLGSFRGDPPQQSLANLPNLQRFVGQAGKGFSTHLADPIADSLKILSRAIADQSANRHIGRSHASRRNPPDAAPPGEASAHA